ATVSAGFFFAQPQPLQDQEPQGQQRQRHVVVPAVPAAHLVVAQADLPLALLQELLDPVPLPVGVHHLRQRHLGRRVAQRVPRLGRLPQAADPPQPLHRPDVPLLVLGLHARRLGRLDQQRPLLPRADLQPPPRRRRLQRRPLVGPAQRRLGRLPARAPLGPRRLAQV